jgi:Domain of unknown function (DUF1841)
MLFGQDRDQLRAMYCQAWQRYRDGLALEPLQAQIVAVVSRHPEYQPLLEHPDRALGREYLPESGETNPFLHMGLHLAIQEQIDTDRPAGIRELYRGLAAVVADTHELDHRLMACLAEAIWQAQRDATEPDEQQYLHCISAISKQNQ